MVILEKLVENRSHEFCVESFRWKWQLVMAIGHVTPGEHLYNAAGMSRVAYTSVGNSFM